MKLTGFISCSLILVCVYFAHVTETMTLQQDTDRLRDASLAVIVRLTPVLDIPQPIRLSQTADKNVHCNSLCAQKREENSTSVSQEHLQISMSKTQPDSAPTIANSETVHKNTIRTFLDFLRYVHFSTTKRKTSRENAVFAQSRMARPTPVEDKKDLTPNKESTFTRRIQPSPTGSLPTKGKNASLEPVRTSDGFFSKADHTVSSLEQNLKPSALGEEQNLTMTLKPLSKANRNVPIHNIEENGTTESENLNEITSSKSEQQNELNGADSATQNNDYALEDEKEWNSTDSLDTFNNDTHKEASTLNKLSSSGKYLQTLEDEDDNKMSSSEKDLQNQEDDDDNKMSSSEKDPQTKEDDDDNNTLSSSEKDLQNQEDDDDDKMSSSEKDPQTQEDDDDDKMSSSGKYPQAQNAHTLNNVSSSEKYPKEQAADESNRMRRGIGSMLPDNYGERGLYFSAQETCRQKQMRKVLTPPGCNPRLVRTSYCQGTCHSRSVPQWDVETQELKRVTYCTCCKPHALSYKRIIFRCPRRAKNFVFYIGVATQCACRPCSDGNPRRQQPYDY